MTVTDDVVADIQDAIQAFADVLKADRHTRNVRDYANADGIVTEESLWNALQQQTDVFIPGDIGIVLENPIVLDSNKRIWGSGALIAAPNRPAGWVMFNVIAEQKIHIEGITLDANAAMQTMLHDAVRLAGTTKDVTVRGVTFTGWGYGVMSPADGQYRDHIQVIGCSFTGGVGAISGTSWRRSRIASNVCDGQSHFGISIYNARNTIVLGNEVKNTARTSSASAGISAATAQDCGIVDNDIHDTACHALRLDTNAHRTRVSGNRMKAIGWVGGAIPPGSGASCGVAAWVGSTDAFSLDVTIDRNVMEQVAGYGISAHGGLDGICIEGNVIKDVGDPGIAVQAAGRIIGNKISNSDGPGIVLGWDDDNANTHQAHDQIVALNEITDTGMEGIRVSGATRFTIRDNMIRSAGEIGAPDTHWSGIRLSFDHPLSHLVTSDGLVSGNVISDCSGYGIERASDASVRVGDNMLVDNTLGEDWP